MQRKLSRVLIALIVVGTLVGAVGVVSADMNSDEADAPIHNVGDFVGHMADNITAMGEMAHMDGSMTEHMNDHEPGEHHDRNHHGDDYGHC